MVKSLLKFVYWNIYKQTNFSQSNEEQVLQSINLDLYDVRVILIETGDQENNIIEYLLKFNYHLHTRVDRNCIFLKKVI